MDREREREEKRRNIDELKARVSEESSATRHDIIALKWPRNQIVRLNKYE